MSAVRPAVRALRMPSAAARRFQSTSTDSAATKAAAGLNKVAASAGPAIASAAKALSNVGGPIGKAVAAVEKSIPHITYYSKVTLELGKFVAAGQNMAPPSLATFQAYYTQAFNALKSPAKFISSAQQTLAAARKTSITCAQLAAAGVLGAELLGFFTVGEIIGRFKLIGYHGEGAAAHH